MSGLSLTVVVVVVAAAAATACTGCRVRASPASKRWFSISRPLSPVQTRFQPEVCPKSLNHDVVVGNKGKDACECRRASKELQSRQAPC